MRTINNSVARLLKSLALTIFSTLLLSCLALAQVETPQERMRSILKNTMRADATLTREVHQEFWGHLSKFSDKEQSDFLRLTGSALNELYGYQVEILESVVLSYRNRKVVKTGKLISLESAMQKNIVAKLPLSLTASERAAAIKEFESRSSISFADNEKMLEAAATHQPIDLPGRGRLTLNEDIFQQMRESLQPSSSRLKRLLDPVWAEDNGSKNRTAAIARDDIDSASKSRAINDSDKQPDSVKEPQTATKDLLANTERDVPMETGGNLSNVLGKSSIAAISDAQAKPASTKADILTVDNAVLAKAGARPNVLAVLDSFNIQPTKPGVLAAALAAESEQATVAAQAKREAEPSLFEMVAAGFAGNTDQRIIKGTANQLFAEKYEKDWSFQPDLSKVVDNSREGLNEAVNARNQQEFDAIVAKQAAEALRIKTVMARGATTGYILLYGAKYWWLIVLVIAGLIYFQKTMRKSVQPSPKAY